MDVKCSRERVLRLPGATRDDINFREQVEDRQASLHEEWAAHADQHGLPHATEHVKHATETWASFTTRKEKQSGFLNLNQQLADEECKKSEAAKKSAQERADAVIQKLSKHEDERRSQLLKQRHFLYVNFFQYQQFVFEKQRECVGRAEEFLREKISGAGDELLFSMVSMWHVNSELQQIRERERIQNELLQKRLHEEELQRKADEEKQREAERIAKEREAAQAEKEQAELEKRLERKRREEERRAKAKAERERIKSL